MNERYKIAREFEDLNDKVFLGDFSVEVKPVTVKE